MSNKNPGGRGSERLKQIHQILDGLSIKRKLSSSGGGGERRRGGAAYVYSSKIIKVWVREEVK